MSNRQSASVQSAASVAAGAVFLEIRAGARRMLIEELGVFSGAATAFRFGIVRASAQGTGGASTMTGTQEDPSQAAATGLLAVNAFTTAPTVGTNYLKRANLAAAIGAGIIWTWPQSDRLIVPASGSV